MYHSLDELSLRRKLQRPTVGAGFRNSTEPSTELKVAASCAVPTAINSTAADGACFESDLEKAVKLLYENSLENCKTDKTI